MQPYLPHGRLSKDLCLPFMLECEQHWDVHIIIDHTMFGNSFFHGQKVCNIRKRSLIPSLEYCHAVVAGSQGLALICLFLHYLPLIHLKAKIQFYLEVISQRSSVLISLCYRHIKALTGFNYHYIYVFQCNCNEFWIFDQSPVHHLQKARCTNIGDID